MPSPAVNDIGSMLDPKPSISPQALSAGVANGAAVDRLGAKSAQAIFATGADSGSPTSLSVACKIQHSSTSDFSSDVEDYEQAEPTTLTSEDTLAKINFNLERAKRYVRAVATVSFDGGSTPTVLVSSAITLGGLDNYPRA